MRRRRSIVLPLSLFALLCLAGTARALTVDPPPLPPVSVPAAEGADEEVEGDEFVEECEEEASDEEQEECEEELLEAEGPLPPDECLLRTARARVSTYAPQEKVRLTIRYTSTSPVEVLVDYRVRGGRGSIVLGHARQHFSQRGVARIAEHLGPAEMERVRAAKSIVVELTIPSAPSGCDRFYTRHLTIRHSIHHQVVWLQSDSIFGG